MQNSQDNTLNQVEKQVPETKNWFNIVFHSVLGFFAAITVVLIFAFMLFVAGFWIRQGYIRWFDTDELTAVGQCGYFYDPDNECFVNPKPNRRVLQGCKELVFNQEDSIGIVLVGNNRYRYVNLNTLSFINDRIYFRADMFTNGRAIALDGDTLFHIAPNGETILAEASDWVYASIREITYDQPVKDSDGDIFYQDVPTGMYTYEDAWHRLGLMSGDFVRLTPPLFSDITAESKDVFFAEYLDSGLGVLINRKGTIIK